MARFARKGLMSALEEAEVVDQVPAQDDNEIKNQLVEIAQQEVQTQEEATSLERLHLHVEEAIDEVTDGEKLIDTIEEVASSENGEEEGLTEKEAMIAEESLRRIYRRLGIPAQSVMPSMESFRSASSRKMATRLAIEDARSKLKEMWERIIEAIRGLFKRIKDFFKRMVTNVEKKMEAVKTLVRKIETLYRRSRKAPGEFEDERMAQLVPGKGPYTEEHITKMVDAHFSQCNLVLDHAEFAVVLVNELFERKDLNEKVYESTALKTVDHVGRMIANTPLSPSQREVVSEYILYSRKVSKAELEIENSRYNVHVFLDDTEPDTDDFRFIVRDPSRTLEFLNFASGLTKIVNKFDDLMEKLEKDFDNAIKKFTSSLQNGEENGFSVEVKAFASSVYNNTLGYITRLNTLNAGAIDLIVHFLNRYAEEFDK
jgi:hypothetical protein